MYHNSSESEQDSISEPCLLCEFSSHYLAYLYRLERYEAAAFRVYQTEQVMLPEVAINDYNLCPFPERRDSEWAL